MEVHHSLQCNCNRPLLYTVKGDLLWQTQSLFGTNTWKVVGLKHWGLSTQPQSLAHTSHIYKPSASAVLKWTTVLTPALSRMMRCDAFTECQTKCSDMPWTQKNSPCQAIRDTARLHAEAVLNMDSAWDKPLKEWLQSPPAVLHLWWRGRSMCRSESRLFCCPETGCGIRTSPRLPGSAVRPAERHPGSETRGLWEEESDDGRV